MRRTKTGPILLVILASILLATSCATIIRKSTQGIPVTSSPAGATVSVNGQPQGVTPLEIRLARKLKGQVIRIESPGYNPAEIRLQRRMSFGPVAGNILLGLIPGVIPAFAWKLDHDESLFASTSLLIWSAGAAAVGGILTSFDLGGPGKGYELKPTELTVTLTKTVGTPGVDTIFIDPSDLQNIKWIRVRRD